jgi:hypothetical protein
VREVVGGVRGRWSGGRTSGTMWISFRSKEILEIISNAANPVLPCPNQTTSTFHTLTLTRNPLLRLDSQSESRSLVQPFNVIDRPCQNLLWCLFLKILVDLFELFRGELGFEGGHCCVESEEAVGRVRFALFFPGHLCMGCRANE